MNLEQAPDLANNPQPWTSLGFPTLSNISDYRVARASTVFFYVPSPSYTATSGSTTPYTRPSPRPCTPANLGVAILRLVLERVSNTSYAELTQSAILTPLGLGNTTVSTPLSLPNAFVPGKTVDEDLWDVNLGRDIP